MQGGSEEDISDTVIQAKKDLAEFTHTGRFWEYQRVRDILGAADPLSRCVPYLTASLLCPIAVIVLNIPTNVCVLTFFLFLACWRKWTGRDWWWETFLHSFLCHRRFLKAPPHRASQNRRQRLRPALRSTISGTVSHHHIHREQMQRFDMISLEHIHNHLTTWFISFQHWGAEVDLWCTRGNNQKRALQEALHWPSASPGILPFPESGPGEQEK